MIQKLNTVALLLVLAIFSVACSTKNDFEAFKEAKYSLASIKEVQVNGVNLLEKNSPQDFSFSDAAALFTAFSENKLMAESTLGLNVDLGEGNIDRTMTVSQLKWQLLVEDKQTLSGLINEPVELRNGLNMITVKTPVAFAAEGGGANLNNLLRLAALLTNEEGSKPSITLQIKPTILTSIGPIELPGYINIKD